MSCIERYDIKNLNTDIINAFIICILIGKSDAREFDSKQDRVDKRGVITLTVRDSKRDFINCVVWGSDSFIQTYNLELKIGECINIISPRISIKYGDYSENCNPITTSPFLLTINEGRGRIVKYTAAATGAAGAVGNSDTICKLKSFFNEPIKPVTSVLSLKDLSNNCIETRNDFADVLVIVRQLKSTRNIQTKTGEKLLRELIVMDQSYPGMALQIWNRNLILRSELWQEMSTVLHLINVRVNYSQFYKSIILSIHGRTLITENPNAKEARMLIKYSEKAKLRDIDIICYNSGGNNFSGEPGSSTQQNQCITQKYNIHDLPSITTVMSVQQIYDRAEGNRIEDEDQFYCLIYAVVTKLDLDGWSNISSKKCIRCQKRVSLASTICDNPICMSYQQDETQMNVGSIDDTSNNLFNNSNYSSKRFIEMFDINVNLSDHTGTLTNCRMIDTFAERILNYSWSEFSTFNDDERANVKWKFLLERCAVKLLVKRKSAVRSNIFISILDCNVAEMNEVQNKIKVY